MFVSTAFSGDKVGKPSAIKRDRIAAWVKLPGSRPLVYAAMGMLIFVIAFLHDQNTQWPEDANDFLFLGIFGPLSLIFGLVGVSTKLKPKSELIQKIGSVATALIAIEILCLIGLILLNASGIWGVELMLKAGSLVLLMIVLAIAAIIATAVHKSKFKKATDRK